jgi:hypothetical protein
MKTAAHKERELKEMLQTQEECRRHYDALSKYELEYVGGPYAGWVICRGTNEYVDGQYVEVQPPLDGQGRAILPHGVYRYRNGAFHWMDPSKKHPPTKECPTCGGKGYVKDEFGGLPPNPANGSTPAI